MKIEIIPIKEPKSSPTIIDMIHGLMHMAHEYNVDKLAFSYEIDGKPYSYSYGKK